MLNLFFITSKLSVLSSVIKVDLSLYDAIPNKSNLFNETYNLTDYESELKLVNIHNNVQFLVVQVHSLLHNVTLKLTNTAEKIPTVTGANVGLVYVRSSDTVTYSLSKLTSNDTRVLITILAYDRTSK